MQELFMTKILPFLNKEEPALKSAFFIFLKSLDFAKFIWYCIGAAGGKKK